MILSTRWLNWEKKFRETKLKTWPERGSEHREAYWLRIDPAEEFTKSLVNFEDNNHLTRHLLFLAICNSARQQLTLEQFYLPAGGFLEELSLVMKEHDEGQELLTMRPYFLSVTRQFGYLADFHFRQGDGIPFSRRIQQLSLSLDENYRRNLNYYSDRLSKITHFLEQRHSLLQSIQL